jgi:hypothetical protein
VPGIILSSGEEANSFCSDSPHALQNRAPSRFLDPHSEQNIPSPSLNNSKLEYQFEVELSRLFS